MIYIRVVFLSGDVGSFLVPGTMTMADFEKLAWKARNEKFKAIQIRDVSKTSIALLDNWGAA